MTTQTTRRLSKFAPRGSLQLREKLVDHGYWDYLEAGQLEWPDNSETKEEWKERMEREGEYADHVIIQLTANVLNRDTLYSTMSYGEYSTCLSFLSEGCWECYSK